MGSREIYVSTDVEADGPIPGPHSMLSVGSAAFLADKTLVSTFEVNLETLPDASPHPDTMQWWEGFPDAWEASRRDPRPPTSAMQDYCVWLDALPGRPVFVAYPAGFDFTFVRWYLMKFAGRCPFGFASLDVKSFAMARLGTRFHDTHKRTMPRAWFDRKAHTHRALDDAIEQGELFCNMLADVERIAMPVPEAGAGFALVGTDDERLEVIVRAREGDGDELQVEVGASAGGLRADVAASLSASELREFWSELRSLRAGDSARAVLEPQSGSPFVEVASRDSGAAVRATIRDPAFTSGEMRTLFLIDARAIDDAIGELESTIDAFPPSGTTLWD